MQLHPNNGVEFYLKRTTWSCGMWMWCRLLLGECLNYIWSSCWSMMWLTLQALEYRLELCRAALVGAAEPSTYYLVENRRLQLTYWVGLLTWIDHHELYNFRHQANQARARTATDWWRPRPTVIPPPCQPLRQVTPQEHAYVRPGLTSFHSR